MTSRHFQPYRNASAAPERLAQVDVACRPPPGSARRARRSRARPQSAVAPMKPHTRSSRPGAPSARAIPAGVRKMPTPTVPPTTSAAAAGSPMRRSSPEEDAALRTAARRPSWKARGPPVPKTPPAVVSARPKDDERRNPGSVGLGAVARQHVREARVVRLRDAQDVRDVEDVEALDDRLDARVRADSAKRRESRRSSESKPSLKRASSDTSGSGTPSMPPLALSRVM